MGCSLEGYRKELEQLLLNNFIYYEINLKFILIFGTVNLENVQYRVQFVIVLPQKVER